MKTSIINSTSIFKRSLNGILNFVYPPTCIVTKEKLPDGNSNKFVFDDVLSSIPEADNYSLLLLSFKLNCHKICSLYLFDEQSEIQTVIHHMKYNKMKSIGILMGNLLAEKIKTEMNMDNPILVPVPLHPAKLRERGYNQSLYIAKGISEKLKIPIEEKLVKRIKNTKSQTRLNDIERMENVSGAFEVNKNLSDQFKEKNIILLDDVITTGSTINEIKRVLELTGMKNISAVSIAIAV